jgi:hypothetical protein
MTFGIFPDWGVNPGSFYFILIFSNFAARDLVNKDIATRDSFTGNSVNLTIFHIILLSMMVYFDKLVSVKT